MDQEKINTFIEEQMSKMDPKILRAIKDFDLSNNVTKILTEKGISNKEIPAVVMEVWLFLIGATNPLDFPQNIENVLIDSKPKAKEVAEEIEKGVFTGIYEEAKKNGWQGPSEEDKKDFASIKVDANKKLEAEDFILFDAYNNTPEDLKVFIDSPEFGEKINKVGEALLLSEEEKKQIASVLVSVLLTQGVEASVVKSGVVKTLEEKSLPGEDIYRLLEKEVLGQILKNTPGANGNQTQKVKDLKIKKDISPSLPEAFHLKFKDLKEEVKDAILSADIENRVLEIGRRRALNVEQIGKLAHETYAVIFGFVKPENFEFSLLNNLNIGTERSTQVATEVNTLILRKIRDVMKGVEEKDSKPKEGELNAFTRPEISQAPKPPAGYSSAPQTTDDVLGSTGIKVVENKQEEKPNSISLQKLAGAYKIPPKITDHSLTNLSKQEATKEETSDTSTPRSYTPGTDPYRMPLE